MGLFGGWLGNAIDHVVNDVVNPVAAVNDVANVVTGNNSPPVLQHAAQATSNILNPSNLLNPAKTVNSVSTLFGGHPIFGGALGKDNIWQLASGANRGISSLLGRAGNSVYNNTLGSLGGFGGSIFGQHGFLAPITRDFNAASFGALNPINPIGGFLEAPYYNNRAHGLSSRQAIGQEAGDIGTAAAIAGTALSGGALSPLAAGALGAAGGATAGAGRAYGSGADLGGVLTGALRGGATSAIGSGVGAGLGYLGNAAGLGNIGTGALAGAGSGATGAALNGQNGQGILDSALIGGASGGVGGGLGAYSRPLGALGSGLTRYGLGQVLGQQGQGGMVRPQFNPQQMQAFTQFLQNYLRNQPGQPGGIRTGLSPMYQTRPAYQQSPGSYTGPMPRGAFM